MESTVAPQSSADTRIAASVSAWQRKLLDLTKRNRAINFRPAKVSTVAIVDEQPAEVFRQLVLRQKAMKFHPAPEKNGTEAASQPVSVEAAESSAGDHDLEEYEGTGNEFAPYDPAELDARHTDDYLQTSSPREGLDRSLRRLDEQARSTVEEQGVNTLFLALGMLHYRQSQDSEETFRAPLVLIPVTLTRSSARSAYTVRAAEDDPVVNPALAEYLRNNFGIELPALPDSAAMSEDYDLQALLQTTKDAIQREPGWSVTTDIYLAPFSFQKFAMYKDLEQNADALVRHGLIRQLITRAGDVRSGAAIGLPDDVRQMELDREFPPEQTAQVVDADSSQLRAIAAVARDHDLVIEGPPGTGKSQTITNLIAQALSVGKSVLFVAEKMAALGVVHDRLVKAGLGEFCLELHSTKANKRDVMRALAAALDASLQTTAGTVSATERLPQVRATLTEYANAVHAPSGTIGISPFRAYGELGRVLAAPRVRYGGPIDGSVERETLEQTVRDLEDLAAAATAVGTPATHPWRDATKTFYSEDDLETVRELAERLEKELAELTARAAAVQEAFSLPPVATFADVETAASIAEVLHRSPGAPLSVLGNDAWNQPPAEATSLVERGRSLERLKGRVAKQFTPEVLEQAHESDIAYVEQKAQGLFSFLAIFDGRWRAIKRRWMQYRLSSYQASLVQQANDMKQVDRLRRARGKLGESEARGQDLFGGLWQGERSNWDVLENYIRWVVEFRGVCVRHGLAGKALEVAAKPAPDTSDIDELRRAAQVASVTLAQLRAVVSWPADYLAQAPLADIALRARALGAGVRLGPQWAAFAAAYRTAADSLAGEVVALAMSGEITFQDLAAAFQRAFYMKWLSAVVQQRPALERFHTMTHEERVAEFRRLDQRVLVENRSRLVGQLRDRAQNMLREPDAAAAMPFLRGQIVRQRGHAPLRQTMRQAGAAVRAIKPCFMMSPLTVAQLLDGAAPSFDLVIFDEASQLPPEDAVGAIIRGKQLVVVGDPKQLPPTNFFAVNAGTVATTLGEDDTPVYDDAESILEQYMGAGVPMSRLKWHYRSAHESLIAFSNVQFYDSDLYTFPSVERGTDRYGLQFEHVPDGVYEGKGLNAAEARRVADEVVRFAKEQLRKQERGEAPQSLGVGTFNLRQQLAIQDELEQRRRDDPSIEPFFDRGASEPFFVKNLENIQGDERDVIFISVTYARANDGKLRYNFGPLNGENGWRRLNVLATRARQRMRVFSSMRGDEINPASTTSRGAQLLREFLTYAERGRLESLSASLSADTESPFEAEVLRDLVDRGYQVVPQVGTAGYRIDLGVLDDALPGRFLCGIECDGVAYHSSESARDRDRLRQQVLEARGWVIHRIWSTDWFKDRQGQMERIQRLIEETRAAARSAAPGEQKAPESPPEGNPLDAAEERGAAVVPGPAPYQRPLATAYRVTPGAGRLEGHDLLDAPLSTITDEVVRVVEAEAPIHEADLLTRVAGMWGNRAGSRIQERIREAAEMAQRRRKIRQRGPFYWTPNETCVVRNRGGLRIPADRIAPEEYQQAVLMVLADGHAFSRPQLTSEVRSLLGFARTGAALEEAIGGAIDQLLETGALGEGSTGIRLRRSMEAES